MDQPPIRRRFTSVALAGFAGVTAVAGVATGIAVPAGAASGTGAAVESSTMSSADKSTPATRAVVTADPAAPNFLTAGQLTVSNRYGPWKSYLPKPGLPNPRTFCLKDTLPTEGTTFKTFRSAKGAFGEQYVTVTQSDEDATALIDTLRTSIQNCYKYWLDTVSKGVYKYGKIKASWSRYATYPEVEEGLRIYGVFTVPPKGVAKPMTHMFAIGRDDATVTVVHLGVTGEKEKAPRATFTADATEALEQLY